MHAEPRNRTPQRESIVRMLVPAERPTVRRAAGPLTTGSLLAGLAMVLALARSLTARIGQLAHVAAHLTGDSLSAAR